MKQLRTFWLNNTSSLLTTKGQDDNAIYHTLITVCKELEIQPTDCVNYTFSKTSHNTVEDKLRKRLCNIARCQASYSAPPDAHKFTATFGARRRSGKRCRLRLLDLKKR